MEQARGTSPLPTFSIIYGLENTPGLPSNPRFPQANMPSSFGMKPLEVLSNR